MGYHKVMDYITKTAGTMLSELTPLHSLLPKTGYTHTFCLDQSIKILKADALFAASEKATTFYQDICQGILWADKALKNSSHFYNPVTKKGLVGYNSAIDEGEYYWKLALQSWSNNDYQKAFFYLGACIHLIQDLCVPHHSAGKLFDGHQEFENWAEAHCRQFSVERMGIYGVGDSPSNWIEHNALISVQLYPLIKGIPPEANFKKACKILLPLSQRTIAGFVASFMQKVEH
ncbi:phospholipase C [Desulfitispora alkaliphila]|uniref:zinc dependent phospholipase C family protein n=1 Tax=Desulfitispora alkaliphila TaxID=622674 RepID=UPI003D22BF77